MDFPHFSPDFPHIFRRKMGAGDMKMGAGGPQLYDGVKIIIRLQKLAVWQPNKDNKGKSRFQSGRDS